jgi:hypothetical protein
VITIKGIEPTGKTPDTWGGYDFGKNSLAVVAFGEVRDEMCVLWTVGAHLRMEMEEVGLSAEDVLPEPDGEGIWVWEGHGVWHPGPYEYPDDGEIELVGTYRQPTAEEWKAIQKGECPWNDEEWKFEPTEGEPT